MNGIEVVQTMLHLQLLGCVVAVLGVVLGVSLPVLPIGQERDSLAKVFADRVALWMLFGGAAVVAVAALVLAGITAGQLLAAGAL